MGVVDEIKARADKGYWNSDGVNTWVSDVQMLADLKTLLGIIEQGKLLADKVKAWREMPDDWNIEHAETACDELERQHDAYLKSTGVT